MQRFGPPGADERYFIRCIGRACDGALLDILANGEPPRLTVIGSRPGLPNAAAGLARARPTTARAQYGPDSTITLSQAGLPAP